MYFYWKRFWKDNDNYEIIVNHGLHFQYDWTWNYLHKETWSKIKTDILKNTYADRFDSKIFPYFFDENSKFNTTVPSWVNTTISIHGIISIQSFRNGDQILILYKFQRYVNKITLIVYNKQIRVLVLLLRIYYFLYFISSNSIMT